MSKGGDENADIGDDPELEAIKVQRPPSLNTILITFHLVTYFQSGAGEGNGGRKRETEAASKRGHYIIDSKSIIGEMLFFGNATC